MLTIQILHHEFLGPIKLSEWGPPMEKTIYLILYREQDKFNILYAGDCKKTEDSGFFIKNPNFKCWIDKSGSEKFLYLAILPLFESETIERKRILDKIISQYEPPCNSEETPTDHFEIYSEPEPEPVLSENTLEKQSCNNCGGELKLDQVFANVVIMRCTKCGISHSKTKL